jgi:integrase
MLWAEGMELLRDSCEEIRALAMIDTSLFVSLTKPHKCLMIGGVETRLRELGKRAAQRVYPHKFRLTLATRAIDKGMPIEQATAAPGPCKN